MTGEIIIKLINTKTRSIPYGRERVTQFALVGRSGTRSGKLSSGVVDGGKHPSSSAAVETRA
jgi:hypothetical protein